MAIWVASSNVPGYLPMDDDQPRVHINSEDDAKEIASIIASDIARDGNASAETCDPDSEDAAGDYGMVELAENESSDFYGDLIFGIKRAIRANAEYNYRVNWNGTGDTISYFAMPVTDYDGSHAPKCSDDS